MTIRSNKRGHEGSAAGILLANVQLLDNKMDELRARIQFQGDVQDLKTLVLDLRDSSHIIPLEQSGAASPRL